MDPPLNEPPVQNNEAGPRANVQNITSNTSLRPPKPLVLDSNVEVRWKEWIQQFNWYAIATQLSTKPNAVQAATLMASMGLEAASIFNTFNLSEEIRRTSPQSKSDLLHILHLGRTKRTNAMY